MARLSDSDKVLKRFDEVKGKLDEFYRIIDNIKELRGKIETVSKDYEKYIQQAQVELEKINQLESKLETEFDNFQKRRSDVYETISFFETEKMGLEALKDELLSFQKTQKQALVERTDQIRSSLEKKLNDEMHTFQQMLNSFERRISSLQDIQKHDYEKLEKKIDDQISSFQPQMNQLTQWVEELRDKKLFGFFSKKSKK